MKRTMLLLLALVTIASIGGCGKPNPLGPDETRGGRDTIIVVTPPESTWTEHCDTTVTSTVVEASDQLSASNPRKVFAEYVNIACDDHYLPDTVYVTNNAGSDAAFVKYLETLPGRTPYHRYYFTNAAGDTLLRPNPTNGTTTYFKLTAENVPAGEYMSVAVYKGTTQAPASAAHPASDQGTDWFIAMGGKLYIKCIDCRLVWGPKPK